MTGKNAAETADVTELTDVHFVGPATAELLDAEEVTPEAILEKRVSYDMLVEMGVNAGVATKIRREHSLSWSFEGGKGLDRRSTQIRGLQDGERAWIAASSGDWENAEPPTEDATTDGGGTSQDAERAWRDRSGPDPVTSLDGIGEAYAARLAEAGITSVRSLAVADPEHVADSLDIAPGLVEEWYADARRRS